MATPPSSSSGPDEAPRPWTPPETTLPASFVETAVFLHRHGMADPRGGELRVVSVPEYYYGGVLSRNKCGWLLPATAHLPRRLVDLYGVAHPVDSSGRPGSLVGVLDGVGEFRYSPGGPNRRLVASLLFLRGEVLMAEALYAEPDGDGDFVTTVVPFLSALWRRAAWAYAYRDWEIALQSGTLLKRYWQDCEREALRLLGEPYLVWRNGDGADRESPSFAFPFLGRIDALVAGAERWRDSGIMLPRLGGLDNLPAEERIQYLIHSLDGVTRGNSMIGDTVHLHADPIVKALVREGHAALEPLFEAIEGDSRLTLAYIYRNALDATPHLIPVRAAAIEAVQGILGDHHVDTDRPYRLSADFLREVWKGTYDLPPAERWLAILQDDGVGSDGWAKAAQALFTSSEVIHKPGMMISPPAHYSLPVEPLNVIKLPEAQHAALTAALTSRTFEVARIVAADPPRAGWVACHALTLARCLVLWDRKWAWAAVENAVGAAMDLLARHEGDTFQDIGGAIGRTVAAFARDGNDPLMARYLAWLPNVPPRSEPLASRAFEPLVTLRDHPEVQAATRRIFTGPGSPWNLEEFVRRDGIRYVQRYIVSPLARLEVVQEVLLNLLKDRTSFAEIRREENGMLRTYIDGEKKDGYGVDGTDPHCPPLGARRPFRVCDAVMRALYCLYPVGFEVYWPDSVKNEIIERFILDLPHNPWYLIDRIPSHERWDRADWSP
ncbi:MAG: hypothetical protein ACO1SV_26305 [Fimbriimonas sp.]